MTLVLAIRAPRRQALLDALGLDDDGAGSFEIGRPETGATCAIVDDGGGAFRALVPLMRTPTSAADLLPALAQAVAAAGGSVDGDPDLVGRWEAAHKDACGRMARAGAPPPPHMPRAALVQLHGWLLAVAETPGAARPILAVVEPDGRALPCVALAPLLPPVPLVIVDVDGEARVLPVERFGAPGEDGFIRVDPAVSLDGAEPLGERRIVTPVEIVDDEALAG